MSLRGKPNDRLIKHLQEKSLNLGQEHFDHNAKGPFKTNGDLKFLRLTTFLTKSHLFLKNKTNLIFKE